MFHIIGFIRCKIKRSGKALLIQSALNKDFARKLTNELYFQLAAVIQGRKNPGDETDDRYRKDKCIELRISKKFREFDSKQILLHLANSRDCFEKGYFPLSLPIVKLLSDFT